MPISGKFLGETKGNRTNPINVSESALGSGESHSGAPSSKFIGKTKGNTDLPINRSEGVSTGHGGRQGPR
jgi:hypothetical protein